MKKSTVYLVFALMMALLLTVTFFSARMREQEKPFDIGDYSGADRAAAAAAYAESGSTDDLVYLLKVLCYQYKAEGDASAESEIRSYGQELLDRAKDQTVDLESLDENGEMLQILSVIRSTGAK